MDGTRIDCTGSFRLDVPPDVAFPLFTPLGEMDWVDGWEPLFLHPRNGELEQDQVFVTAVGGEQTIWSVVRLEAERHRVDYLRVTPGARLARVFVAVEAEEEVSRVRVRYLCTALSAEGAAELRAFEGGFDAMMEEWRGLTQAHLDGRGEI